MKEKINEILKTIFVIFIFLGFILLIIVLSNLWEEFLDVLLIAIELVWVQTLILIIIILLTIVYGCGAFKKNPNKFIKKTFWYSITIFIIIILAKTVFLHWFFIAIFGGLMVICGYSLRGVIDECHEKNN